jgi:cytoskeletal protein RodZ
VSVFYVPWWVLLACSLASAVATYLVLRRTQVGHSPWALFPLTVVLAPVVLVGAMVAALTLSTLLSALVEDRTGAATNSPSEPRAPREHTTRERTTTVERTQPATTEEQPTSTATATSSATGTATATATPTATAYP